MPKPIVCLSEQPYQYLEALTGLASLEMRPNPQRAADWLTPVMNHPAVTFGLKERAARLREEVLLSAALHTQPELTIEMVLDGLI